MTERSFYWEKNFVVKLYVSMRKNSVFLKMNG